MKKLLLSATALIALTAGASAADLPGRRAPVAPVIAAVPVFTWAGFYVGVQAGYAWGDATARVTDLATGTWGAGTLDADGFVGGAHAGFNYQFGSLVFGVEGDLEATNVEAEQNWINVFAAGDNLNYRAQIDFQGSVRGRVGFAFDRALIYATGGLAFANFQHSLSYTDALGGVAAGSVDHTEWGWTLGAGVEYAFAPNLTARVEYRYTRFEEEATVSGINGRADLDQHAVRAGVSYKF